MKTFKICKYLILAPMCLYYSLAFAGEIYKIPQPDGTFLYTDKLPKYDKNIMILSKKTGLTKQIEEEDVNKELSDPTSNEILNAEKKKASESATKASNDTLVSKYTSIEELEKVKNSDLEQLQRAIVQDTNNIELLSLRKENLLKESQGKVNNANSQELNIIENSLKNSNANKDRNQKILKEKEASYKKDKEDLLRLIKETDKK